MKKLENFKTMEKLQLASVYGGKWCDSGSTTSTNSEGCTVNTTEQFNDTDGDGKRGKGESTMSCETVVCG